MAARSNGDGKNAEAAWAWWCSGKTTSPPKPTSFLINSPIQSFSFSHSGIALRKEGSPAGAKAR